MDSLRRGAGFSLRNKKLRSIARLLHERWPVTRKSILANSILWAAAIIAAAILDAPRTLTLILLPSLASIACLVVVPASFKHGCNPSTRR